MPKILLIDDDPRIVNVFGQVLRRAGHEVETATNGKEGMEKVNAAPPDLIITDIMMPEMDGLEILLALRKTQPTIPVIAISGGMRTLPINFLNPALKESVLASENHPDFRDGLAGRFAVVKRPRVGAVRWTGSSMVTASGLCDAYGCGCGLRGRWRPRGICCLVSMVHCPRLGAHRNSDRYKATPCATE